MTESAEKTETKPDARPFEAEVSKLLHMMVHSVYSNRDIFLRELISNAADACEKLRYSAIEAPSLLENGGDFSIRIEADKSAGTLTVSDNGIGMDDEALVSNLGTIARSGTKAFLDSLGEGAEGKDEAGSRLIGQFGVGFYSAFMVADKVTLLSRPAGGDKVWQWESDGLGAYTVSEADDQDVERGTRVILHMKDDASDYLETHTIERIVKEYSAHVPVPIALSADAPEDADEEDGEQKDGRVEKELTDGQALWRKPKSEISDEEYKEFYGHVSHQFDDPSITLHYRAEGRTEYTVLLYVPSMKPFDLFDPERKGRIRLYVRRVFITDDAKILPAYLRFVRGVVDSEDLPLNISREMLQSNPVLESIRKAVSKRVLSELEKTAKKDAENYKKIWEAFGPVIKEGLYEDFERRDQLFGLCRFRTTKSGEDYRSLEQYIADLKENQTAVYYVLGDDEDAVLASPHLEGYRKKDVEVLLLTDPVDAFWVQNALGYEGKPFKSITQGGADLDQIKGTEDEDSPEEIKADEGDAAKLVAFIKDELGDAVQDVKKSGRLDSSPACLVAPEYGPDKQLQKILAQNNRGTDTKPILEINADHPMVAAMIATQKDGGNEAFLKDAAHLLYGQAKILDGEAPADPAAFVGRLAKLVAEKLGPSEDQA